MSVNLHCGLQGYDTLWHGGWSTDVRGKKLFPPASVMMEAALSSETLATAYRTEHVIVPNYIQPKATGLHMQPRSE